MLRLLKTRACRRCGGDLSLEWDQYGAYVNCIQCGAVWNQLEPDNRLPEPQPVVAVKPRARVNAS